MAQNNPGSIQSVSLNGQAFDVPADVDAEFLPARVKNEALASTGRSMKKSTRIVPEVKNLIVFANLDEVANIKTLVEQIPDYTMNVKLYDGSVWRASGWADLESWSSMEAKAKISLFPRTDWSIAVTP